MNIRKLIQDNWKGAVVGVAVMAAAAYGGPIASKAVGFVLPKALEHVSNTPIEDVAARVHPSVPRSPTPTPKAPVMTKQKALLRDVARDWGVQGRLSCVVVQP